METRSVCIKECDEYRCPQSSNEETNARGIQNVIRERRSNETIFDYLIGIEGEKIQERGKRKQGYSCIIAGNLDKQKSAYVYELPKDIAFDLYGPNYTGQAGGNICYHGSFPPAELPYELEGNFGLVWDGISVDTCARRLWGIPKGE